MELRRVLVRSRGPVYHRNDDICGWRASSHSACAVRSFGVGRTAQQFQPDPCTCHRAVWSELISFSCSGYFVAKQSRSKRRRSLPSPCQGDQGQLNGRSEEHTSELQSLMRISYAVFCLKKKKTNTECLINIR